MPKLITVRHLGSLPGESHYEVHTPMGTWGVDMVQYAAGSFEATGYGTRPRWMVTTPGDDRPDATFDRKRDAIAYITTLVNEDLDKNGGDAARMALEAHRMELHQDNSPWAKVAEQQKQAAAPKKLKLRRVAGSRTGNEDPLTTVDFGEPRCAHGYVERPADRGKAIKACEQKRPNVSVGVFSDEGCIDAFDCAVLASDEAVRLNTEEEHPADDPLYQWAVMCADHDEQPKDNCEECAAETADGTPEGKPLTLIQAAMEAGYGLPLAPWANREHTMTTLKWTKDNYTDSTYQAKTGNTTFTIDNDGHSWRLRGWRGNEFSVYRHGPTMKSLKALAQEIADA